MKGLLKSGMPSVLIATFLSSLYIEDDYFKIHYQHEKFIIKYLPQSGIYVNKIRKETCPPVYPPKECKRYLSLYLINRMDIPILSKRNNE